MREIKFRVWDNNTMFYNVNVGFSNPSVFNGAWSECTEKVAIMQYTGLKDKNGVEIYEGDIVIENGIKREIKYGYCEVDEIGSTGDYAYGFNLYHDCSRVEVIGNIYENKDLIK